MFDRVNLTVKAGKGGEGAISFRREKHVPFGGPDGGDGGAGGSVIIRADPSVESLAKFKRKRYYHAPDGVAGHGQKKHGKKGADLILTVPPGTLVWNKTAVNPDEALLADLERVGQEVVAAEGGRGGWGNTRFATSTNQAPQIAQRGAEGDEASLYLEMRLIADVGIVGYPNAGKSTLLAAASAARPKIAGYPFTTLEPVLGVVEVEGQSFVMAEIPGLITDAHLGRGLGHDFLRHVARTKVLLHLLDGSEKSVTESMTQVNRELAFFDSALARKPQIVAVNKIDVPEVKEKLFRIKKEFNGSGIRTYFISAATGEGVTELMVALFRSLHQLAEEKEKEKKTGKVFRPRPAVGKPAVTREGGVFIINDEELGRLTTRDGRVSGELKQQIKRRFARKGISKALEKAGIKPGDKVRCGILEWEW